MKKLILSILLLSTLNATDWNRFDDPDRPWLKQRDNAGHILINAAISGGVTILARQYGLNKTEAFFVGIGTGILLGFIKEKSDKNFSGSDMGSWAAGAALGATGGVIWRF